MGFEIDFMAFGNGEKSGDAISLRYGEPGNYTVIVIDGGTKEAGKDLVYHINNYYDTSYVDYVINTHPDKDHASGLTIVLEELSVGELLMHLPWEHSEYIRNAFKDGRITDNSLSERLKDAYNSAFELYNLAANRGIPVREPFAGEDIGILKVLSPTKEFYEQNLITSDKTPEVGEKLFKFFKEATQKVYDWIEESWDVETLRENVSTSPENENSVILYGNYDNRGFLFTGDAGIKALSSAADYAEISGINLTDCRFQQIPHHGSRNNVSPSVLNRIIGAPLEKGQEKTMSVFVSASKNSTTHPRKAVVNAYIRRGAKVFSSGDGNGTKHHYYNMPAREGWKSAVKLQFSDTVERWD